MATATGGSREFALIGRIYREAMPILLLTSLAELMAGSLLIRVEESVATLIGFFTLVPGLMELRGNISSSLAQRLGSATHLGTISWKQGLNEPLKANIKSSFILVSIMSFFLGIGAYSVSYFALMLTIGQLGQLRSPLFFVSISMMTAILASAIQVTITVLVSLLAHARGFDPDNITIPIVATIGDIITVVCLLTSIWIIIPLPI
ncbi:MAG: magnesium transporter [Promethearchaeota archaeon]